MANTRSRLTLRHGHRHLPAGHPVLVKTHLLVLAVVLQLLVQLHGTFGLRAVPAAENRGGGGHRAEHRAVESAIGELQWRRAGSGVNGGGADASFASRQAARLPAVGQGTLRGGFERLLQHFGQPKLEHLNTVG